MDIHERAKQTMVFEHPDGSTIIVAHPGQSVNMDPKYLRETFGIMPQHMGLIKPMSESRARPLTVEEKRAERPDLAARAAGLQADLEDELKARTAERDARIEELEARNAELEAHSAELEAQLTAGASDKPAAKAK